MLRHVSERGRRRDAGGAAAAAGAGFGRDLLDLSLAASAATIVVTALLFVVIPRVGQAALPLRARAAAWCPASPSAWSWAPSARSRPTPPWSCACTSREFAGGTGRAGGAADAALARHRLRPLRRPRRGRWAARRSSSRCAASCRCRSRSTSTTAGRSSPRRSTWSRSAPTMIFGAPRVLRLQGRSDFVTVDDLGNIAVPAAGGAAALHGRVGAGDRRPAPGRHRRRAAARAIRAGSARFTQLPPLSPRIARARPRGDRGQRRRLRGGAAAHRLAEPRADLHARAGARRPPLDPLEEFLFVRRSGNCEYFAAALAVMLRSLGIPARVVNGFQRGEWNPYGALLHGPPARRPLLGGGLRRRRRLGHARSLARAAPWSRRRWRRRRALARRAADVVVPLRGQLEPARPAGRRGTVRRATWSWSAAALTAAGVARLPAAGAGRGRAAGRWRLVRRGRLAPPPAASARRRGRAALLRARAAPAGPPGAGARRRRDGAGVRGRAHGAARGRAARAPDRRLRARALRRGRPHAGRGAPRSPPPWRS